MRTLEAGFAAHVASGATTLANCWKIVRADSSVLGFTDHDRTLSFGGTDFLPALGLDGGERTGKLGPEVDTSEVVGILHSDAIREEDILLGRYDGAEVETWRVNWADVSQRLLLSRATIGEIVREDGRYRAELRSGQQALNQVQGRVYGALCDAELGDARCGVDLADARYRGDVVVTAVKDRFRLAVDGAGGFDEGWFSLGVMRWDGGGRDGIADRVLSHQRLGDEDVLAFAAPVGDWVGAGDAAELTAGCDRRFSTCRMKFDNAVNFRGFPHIPGNDFVLRYPREGTARDGRVIVE